MGNHCIATARVTLVNCDFFPRYRDGSGGSLLLPGHQLVLRLKTWGGNGNLPSWNWPRLYRRPLFGRGDGTQLRFQGNHAAVGEHFSELDRGGSALPAGGMAQLPIAAS